MRKLLGQTPWPKQIEIAEKVFKFPRVEVSGCVASTKTYCAAMIVLLWLLRWGPGSRVFSIAPSFRQVDTNLWGYIPKLVRASEANGTPLGCKVFAEPHVEFHDRQGKPCGWYYQGFSTDKPGNVHGIHALNHDLLIMDDWQGISKAMQDELDNMLAGGNTHFLCLHNRVVNSGPSYDCAHKDAKLWEHVSISFWDMPNSKPELQAQWIPGALDIKTVEFWGQKYGKKSNFYRTKVDNEYPTASPDTLIPLNWVEAAFARQVDERGPLHIGGDVARFGDDSSAMAKMRGRAIQHLESWAKFDLMYTAGKFAGELKTELTPDETGLAKQAYAFIDVVGMGGGVVDRLAEQKVGDQQLPVTGVDCGEAAGGPEDYIEWGGKKRLAKDVFVNLRSRMWWNLRERLDPNSKEPQCLVSLPQDLELQAQLTEVKYRIASDGRIEVEPKSSPSSQANSATKWGLKNRLGHSPDKADAVVLVVWGADQGALAPASSWHSEGQDLGGKPEWA